MVKRSESVFEPSLTDMATFAAPDDERDWEVEGGGKRLCIVVVGWTPTLT